MGIFFKYLISIFENQLSYDYYLKSFYLILSVFLGLVFYFALSLFIKAFKYEDFNWQSLFPWNFGVSNPEIIDGEGRTCAIATDVFSIVGESPGSCYVKYPSTNGENEGFIFFTITVVEG